jgi:quercetin dioxygenase-like cupin family protein
MKHTPAADVEWSPAPAQNFTGTVRFGPLSRVEGGINAVAVEFQPGARTDWHHHPDGQVLYVASGSGLVQSEDGTTVEIQPGDVVYAPPGEVHWHGAAPDSPMTHLSLTTGGATEWHPRKVSDEEYQSRG